MKTKVLTLVLILFIANGTPFAQEWAGKWEQKKNKYTLEITKVNNINFDFKFECFDGTNFGEAEGKAIIKGNEAIYDPNDN